MSDAPGEDVASGLHCTPFEVAKAESLDELVPQFAPPQIFRPHCSLQRFRAILSANDGGGWMSLLNGDVEFAVVDVETTGFAPRFDRVIEVAVVRVRSDGQRLGDYSTLINPERDVGPSHVHGITATDVLAAPRFDEVLGDLIGLLRGAIIVGHNVRFDLGFLRAEALRSSCELPAAPSMCTLALSHRLGIDLPRRKLHVCCDHEGIELIDAHSALGDANATAALLLSYLERARALGIASLIDLGCESGSAATLAWPNRRPSGRAVGRSQPGLVPDDGSFIHRLLQRLETAPNLEVGVEAYFDVLDRVLEDRQITEVEADSLYEVARTWHLSSDDVRRAHRRYLRALVDAALGDGHISSAEEKDLEKVARLLGIEPQVIAEVRVEARASSATVAELAAVAPRQTPSHGLKGKSICFTGSLAGAIAGERITRMMAESLARTAGLEVCDRVSRELDILVVADPNTQSTKAKKARSYGTRILAEMELWRVLGVPVS